MPIHSGHRQRVKERFMKKGLEAFNDYEILELLLFYAIPRSNTNEIAHRLIDHFGSLVQVLEAPVRELEKIEGIGAGAAMYLSLLRQTHRHLNISQVADKTLLQSIDDYANYLKSFFFGQCNEMVYLLCMDAKNTVINCYEICEGGVHSANISFRRIIDIAIQSNAVTVVLAHNHPGGLALPSPEDIMTTKRLAKALYMADIVLADHIVVAGQDYISMYLSQIYNPADVLGEE